MLKLNSAVVAVLSCAVLAPQAALADLNLFAGLWGSGSAGDTGSIMIDSCHAPGDPLLGGVNFRGQAFDPKDCQYGAPYLEAIYAHTLFQIVGNPTLATYSAAHRLDAADPATAAKFVSDTNGQLNQAFVLKSIASMLDSEASVKNISSDVPSERVEYVVRKILILDNQNLNDAILQDYVQNKVLSALQSGNDPAKTLAAIGLTSDIIGLVLQSAPVGASGQQTPAQVYQAFRASFDAAVEAMLRAPGHVAPVGVKAPAYSDLTPALLARYDDLMHPTSDYDTMFARLRAKIGSGPFMFGVTWNEASADDRLSYDASSFNDPWRPVVIAGQSPDQGYPDLLPTTLEDFYKFVTDKLKPVSKSVARQTVTKRWFAGLWKNMDLANPNPVFGATHISQQINPLSSLMLQISTQDLADAYQDVKFDVAAQPQPDFTLIDVKLGDAQAPTSGSGLPAVDGCATAFDAAFDKPYKDQQQAVLAALGDPKLSTKRFDQLIAGARDQIPSQAYAAAAAALKADPACASFATSFQTVSVHVDPAAKNVSDDDKSRIQFLAALMQSTDMQKMMVPWMSVRDRAGNVHHYFFKSRKVNYLNPDEPEVRLSLRDVIVERQLADRMKEAVGTQIETRYFVNVLTDAFSYGGVEGFQLKSAAGDPRKWLDQIFVVARPQMNPELLMTRQLVEHGTKTFERAYDMP